MNEEERKKYMFAQLRSLPNATQYVEVTKYFEDLEQQCKRQKEVIDKAVEYINENKDKYYQDWGQDDSSVDTYLGEYEIKELLDILKEVE